MKQMLSRKFFLPFLLKHLAHFPVGYYEHISLTIWSIIFHLWQECSFSDEVQDAQ
jgi:hypothetical protein